MTENGLSRTIRNLKRLDLREEGARCLGGPVEGTNKRAAVGYTDLA